jgi:hypothetical protein
MSKQGLCRYSQKAVIPDESRIQNLLMLTGHYWIPTRLVESAQGGPLGGIQQGKKIAE